MTVRVILNGKSADRPELRDAVQQVREAGVDVEVLVTSESGDAARFATEACRNGTERVVAAGGDGTVSEVLNGLMASEDGARAALCILPLGTANDFAMSCTIPREPADALQLAVGGDAVSVDVASIGEKFFINVATGGFGGEVTANRPPAMMRLLGSAAYSLMGVIMAINAKPYEGEVNLPDSREALSALVCTIGNGRQAGGGKVVAPRAYIDDGLLDVLVVRHFSLTDADQVAKEVANLSADGEFVSYHQTPWVEFNSTEPVPVNLDGEPNEIEKGRVEVLARAVRLVLPKGCPMLERPKTARTI